MNDRADARRSESRPPPLLAADARRRLGAEGAMPTTAPILSTVDSRRGFIRRSVLGIAAVGLAGPATGCGAGGGASPATGVTEVNVQDNRFVPAAIEVSVGATVTWTWQGKHDHNVYADDFESAIQTEGTFAHTFAEPGRYPYRCTLHGGMDGEILVVDPAGAAS